MLLLELKLGLRRKLIYISFMQQGFESDLLRAQLCLLSWLICLGRAELPAAPLLHAWFLKLGTPKKRMASPDRGGLGVCPGQTSMSGPLMKTQNKLTSEMVTLLRESQCYFLMIHKDNQLGIKSKGRYVHFIKIPEDVFLQVVYFSVYFYKLWNRDCVLTTLINNKIFVQKPLKY